MEIPGAARLAVPEQEGELRPPGRPRAGARPALPGDRDRGASAPAGAGGRSGEEGTKRNPEPRGMVLELCFGVRRGFAVAEPCVRVCV